MSQHLSVVVDMTKCEYHGQCVFAAPDLFDITDDDELVYEEHPAPERTAALQAAIDSCPVQAITTSGAA